MVAKLTAETAHNLILRADSAKQVLIHLDLKHLARPGSPAHEPLDVFVPLLILMPSSLTLLFAFGLIEWIIGLTLVLLFQLFLAPLFVRWRTRVRVLRALPNLHNFSLLWAWGGVAITLVDHPEHYCLAPTGNWRTFAATFLTVPADLPAVAT